jgi:hypothetical protein
MQVTHTDLKPENLLIGNENQIKICDFGTGHKYAPGTQWAVNGELSTLWYRAPELLLGSKTFDYKIDLWAIGCIMMEMLSGAAVFQGQPGPQFASPCPDVTHRNFNSDQVHKVLSMAGTPASLAGFECASLIKGWPPFQRHVEPTVTASAGLPALATFSICCLNARAGVASAAILSRIDRANLIKVHSCARCHDTIQQQVVRYCEAKGDAKGNSSASWAQTIGGNDVTCVYGVALTCQGVLCSGANSGACTKARASPQTSSAHFSNQACVHAYAFMRVRRFICSSHTVCACSPN